MQSRPLITCVIPTYRRPQLLSRAIKSVLDQNFADFEIWVYDNASGDETGRTVEALAAQDSRVHYYCHRENIGPQENFIYGLSRVDTPLVHLISDDDFLLPGFYMRAGEALQAHPGAAFFSGGMLSVRPDGQVRTFLRYGIEADQVFRPPSLFHLMARNSQTWTSVLFRHAAVGRLGGLRKETGYSFSVDLILRAAARFEAVLSDAPCAVFVVHPGSSSVAEASEAFESHLNLVYFRSLNQAIETALQEEAITDRDADGMKQLIRHSAERNFFRGALAMIARHNLSGAHRASEILSQHFGRNDLAAVIGAATHDSGVGTVVRSAMRWAKSVRKVWFGRKHADKYSVYSEMVRLRMLALGS